MEAFGVIVGNFDFCSESFNFWFRPYSCWLENSHKEWSERYYSLALSRLPLLIFPVLSIHGQEHQEKFVFLEANEILNMQPTLCALRLDCILDTVLRYERTLIKV